jgi:biopolymer transport protein ExbD
MKTSRVSRFSCGFHGRWRSPSMSLDHGEDSFADIHEINVTPFIDVMLVPLIIFFMVAAPLATVDVAVNLPTTAAEAQPRSPMPIYLSVKADLSLWLADQPVGRDDLSAALAAAGNGEQEARIFLRADKTVPYGELMQVMNLLRGAGFLKIALVGLERAPAP